MYIQSTFIHLDKLGVHKEKELWSKNIFSWEDYQLNIEKTNLFFEDKDSILYSSINALKEKDIDYFSKKIKKSEYYRLAISFPKDVLFLDIETTGLSQYYDHITMIGWSINNHYDYYINGITDITNFIDVVKRAKIIVTFNGSIFDIPFIKKFFPHINFPLCHIDLRFFSKRFNLSGGQKVIEERIKFKRPKSLQNTDGYIATILWDEYKWGKKSSLEKLIAYNFADIEGMKAILDYCIKENFKKLQFKRYFKLPAKFHSKNTKLNKQEIKQIVQNAQIPFDPKSTLKYKELFSKINRNIKIVGIDLTGSEERPTGFCLMKNNNITTYQINKDDDMIKLIIEFKPDIVSIDSPLSLPYGRISVFDDDPGRDKYGILRICERILKKRGVNAYPTLLPSMQKLTRRGIELSSKLRALGIPTIESYPGVVQDIIGLPRKQASLRLLKKGLGLFGLKGKFLKENVSHDEIDAITSALVGMFFLSGDFEAIGDLKENLMVIPNLKAKEKKNKIIGLTGLIASGKTTVGKIFEEKGYKYIRYSQIIEKILMERNMPINRENLQKIGNELNKNQMELSRKIYEEIKDYEKVVIDGLRHPEDYTYFFETYGFNFNLLFIDAKYEKRKERYLNLGYADKDFEKAINNPVEKNIMHLKKLSNKIVYNNSSKNELITNILSIINKE